MSLPPLVRPAVRADVRQHPIVARKSAWAAGWRALGQIGIDRITEGVGQDLGGGTCYHYRTRERNRGPFGPYDPGLAVGDFVRVGTNETTWLWYGVVADQQITPLGTDGPVEDPSSVAEISSTLVGLGWLLSRVPCVRSRVRNAADTANISIDRLLPFQAPWGWAEVGGEIIHAYGGSEWTARKVLQTLLAAHAEALSALDWRLAGQLAALDYRWAGELAGATLLDALAILINPRRGLTWTPEVLSTSGNPVEIHVRSMAAAAVVVDAEYTLPASESIVPVLDATQSQHSYRAAIPAPAAAIRQRASRCTTTLSLHWADASGDSLEPAWDTLNDADPFRWRAWRIRAAWDGSTWGDTAAGLATALTVADGAFTGERTRSGDALGHLAELRRECGCSGAAHDPMAPPLPAVVVTQQGSDNALLDMQLQVYDRLIVLGRSEADCEACQAAIEGGTLIVTTAIVEPLPCLVGAQALSDQLADTLHADTALDQVAAGAVLGVDADGALITWDGANPAPRDDRPRLAAYQALAGPFAAREGSAEWHHGLALLSGADLLQPGALVAEINDGIDRTRVDFIVQRRTWTFTAEGYGTTLSLRPPQTDVAAFGGA